jgi:hypothetical protein
MEAALKGEDADLAPPSVLVRSLAKIWLIGQITAEQAKGHCLALQDVVGSETLSLEVAAKAEHDQGELAALATRQNMVAYRGGLSCTGWGRHSSPPAPVRRSHGRWNLAIGRNPT